MTLPRYSNIPRINKKTEWILILPTLQTWLKTTFNVMFPVLISFPSGMVPFPLEWTFDFLFWCTLLYFISFTIVSLSHRMQKGAAGSSLLPPFYPNTHIPYILTHIKIRLIKTSRLSWIWWRFRGHIDNYVVNMEGRETVLISFMGCREWLSFIARITKSN